MKEFAKRNPMHNRFYSLLLAFVVLLDSIITVEIGSEKNPLILWVMDFFNLGLNAMMISRTLVLWGLIYFLYRQKIPTKWIITAYIGLYIILLIVLV